MNTSARLEAGTVRINNHDIVDSAEISRFVATIAEVLFMYIVDG
ncbi:MAG: hypothetical protein ACR2QI_04115 [Woeseiaceae bacterium]